MTALTDRELWACANQLVEQHGRGAVIKGGERLLDLEAAGDVEGHNAWVMIRERITKLLREAPGMTKTVQ